MSTISFTPLKGLLFKMPCNVLSVFPLVLCGSLSFNISIASAASYESIIAAELLSNKCVDVLYYFRHSGARAIQYSCNGGDNQNFVFDEVGDSYQIKAKHSNLCLAVENASTQQGSRIVQLACDTTSQSQLWKVSGTGAERLLKVNHTGMCMNVSGSSANNFASIIQWPCEGANNEKWRIANLPEKPVEPVDPVDPSPVDPGTPAPITNDRAPLSTQLVANILTGMCISVENASTDSDARALQETCDGGDNQTFIVDAVAGKYRFKAKHSSMCLGIKDASTLAGTDLVQVPCGSSTNQLWSVQGAGNAMQLKVAHSGMCIKIYQEGIQSGTRIVQSNCVASSKSDKFLANLTVRNSKGHWSKAYKQPLVAVAAANLPDGKVLTWSAHSKMKFGGPKDFGKTITAIFDPITGQSTEALIEDTQHDMFCPGTSMLDDGRIMVTGGSTAAATSIYNPATNAWSRGSDLTIPRGYHSNTVLGDGTVFTLGGSWSGGRGNKNGELWQSGKGWGSVSNVLAETFLTKDKADVYRSDNHMWLFTAPNGQVFHAGPSTAMHWVDVQNGGQVKFEANRGANNDSMNGTAVMYDIGKILAVGGANNYDESYAHKRAYTIDLNGGQGNVKVEQLGNMNHSRSFHNSVVLPSGEVVIVGGQEYAEVFMDKLSVFNAEIWNPTTKQFTTLAPMTIPRNYHSIAILLADGRVMVAGSGLCGDACRNNHADVEILTPPYLLDAAGNSIARPVIESAPKNAKHGDTIKVKVNGATQATFALMRLSAITHTVNNDQRRIPVTATNIGGNEYSVSIPASRNIVIPGNYFLFAIGDNGAPSVAKVINVR